MRLNSFYQNERTFSAFILGAIALFLTLTSSSLLKRLDNIYYDLGCYISYNKAPDDVVIVAIDQASLNVLGRWPWSREIHAALIDKLTQEQPKAVGIDIIFSEPELQNPLADEMLAQAIERNGRVVLPILLEQPQLGGVVKQSLPLPKLQAVSHLGSVHVPLEEDGIARGVHLWEGMGIADMPLFAQSILEVADILPATMPTKAPKQVVENKNKIVTLMPKRIQLQGPPGHFKVASYIDVIRGNYPSGFFNNKIVLVGATAVGTGDFLPTSASALLQPMPGVEFHANVIETMRQGKLVSTAPIWLSSIVSILFATIPLLWMPRMRPLHSLFVNSTYFVAVMACLIALPYLFNLWIPVAGGVIAFVFAYPVWSWRKLDAAQRHLDGELKALHADLALLGVDVEDMQVESGADVLQTRITKVQSAANYLRDLQQNRNDTLSFISHDIRAPLGSALLLLNEVEPTKYTERLSKMLGQAHEMADNFLQASSAEMAHASKFQLLDIVSLTQEVTDDAYERARNKRIKINTVLPVDELLVNGDFGLLQRAVMNLLSNAIKYAPENSQVEVQVAQKNHEAIIKITDHGPGIPQERLDRLFKRFSRVEGKLQQANGTGLGLYFVDITIKKHRGEISAESVLGQYTTFTIRLPLGDVSAENNGNGEA